MARGPKKHLKRLNAPRSWMLNKLGGVFAPRPSPGPHKLRECLPICIALRNRLKYALTRREVIMIVMRRAIEIDGKVKTDVNYPAGFQDVVTIAKTSEQFRLLYDIKGRFVLHQIDEKEAQYKLCRVQQKKTGKKSRASGLTGVAASVPYLVTHDARILRYPDPNIQMNDVVKVDIKTNKISGYIKFEIGNVAMVTKGANIGRVGLIVSKERHLGSFDIVHLRDKKGNDFATRLGNVFIIGEGNQPWITLPKHKGLKMSIIEERKEMVASRAEKAAKKAKELAKQ